VFRCGSFFREKEKQLFSQIKKAQKILINVHDDQQGDWFFNSPTPTPFKGRFLRKKNKKPLKVVK